MDEGEFSEGQEMTHRRKDPIPCCLSLVGETAHRIGGNCQKVFVDAYVRKGKSEAFGRAMFLKFAITEGTRVVPETVEAHCTWVQARYGNAKRPMKGFCVLCMGSLAGIRGMNIAYQSLYPEIFSADLSKKLMDLPKEMERYEAKPMPPKILAPKKDKPRKPTEDELLAAMLEEGDFDD